MVCCNGFYLQRSEGTLNICRKYKASKFPSKPVLRVPRRGFPLAPGSLQSAAADPSYPESWPHLCGCDQGTGARLQQRWRGGASGEETRPPCCAEHTCVCGHGSTCVVCDASHPEVRRQQTQPSKPHRGPEDQGFHRRHQRLAIAT